MNGRIIDFYKPESTNSVTFRRVAVVYRLRQKTHDREVLGSNPHCGDHFSGTIHLNQSLEQKLWKNSNLALLHVL
jgi:hypothetical protein